MKISGRITKLNGKDSNLRAFATLIIDDAFVINGIKLMESKKGDIFMSMPSRKNTNGEYDDICFPITAEARAEIFDMFMEMYNEEEAPKKKSYSKKY